MYCVWYALNQTNVNVDVDDDAGQQSHQDLDHHLGPGHGSHHPKHISLHADNKATDYSIQLFCLLYSTQTDWFEPYR